MKQIGLEDEMKPDFSQVTEVALFSQQSNGEISDFSSICYYGNLDMALHLFTKSWTNGITLSEDYESIYAKDSEMLQPNVFTDPKKIESVLKDCYNQHEYNKESCTVYVKGLETVTEMILPNQ